MREIEAAISELREVIRKLGKVEKSSEQEEIDQNAWALDRSYQTNLTDDLETIAQCMEEGSGDKLVNAHRLLYRLPMNISIEVPDSVWTVLDQAASDYYGKKPDQWDGPVEGKK